MLERHQLLLTLRNFEKLLGLVYWSRNFTKRFQAKTRFQSKTPEKKAK